MFDAAKAFDQINPRLDRLPWGWVSLEFVQSEKSHRGETVRPSPRKAPAAREVEPIRAHKLLKAAKVSVTPSAGSNERL